MAENPFDIIDVRLSKIEALLVSIKQNSKDRYTQSETDQFFTIEEASKFLNLSKKTVYSYVSKSQIPSSKKGKRLYFSKQDLTDWIKTGRNKTISEINEAANTSLKIRGKSNSG